MRHNPLMAVAVAMLAISAAEAQQAKSPEAVILLTGDAGQTYSTLGAISVETHQTSLFPKVSREQQLETELRKQAAAMGADAVIHVKYDYSNAATSKKGNTAIGVAVKFATTAAAPVQPVPAPAIVAAAPAAPAVITQPAPAPVIAPTLPAAAPVAAAAAAPVTAPVIAPAPVAAPVAAAPIHATTPEMVTLSESTVLGRPYKKIGPVTVTTHQKSLFPKTPAMTDLQNALKAEALRAGADAVVEVTYTMNNPAFSKKGNTATGVAVRFE